MVCLGSIGAGGKQGEGESEEVKWGSLMMTRLDVARQTVSFLPSLRARPHTHLWRLHVYTRTHSHIATYTHTRWGTCTRPPPSSLLRNYLLFRVLSYKSNWSLWPPANPWGCAGNLSSNVYTQETAQPPEQQSWHSPLPPQHTHTHCLFSDSACSNAVALALPAGQKGAVPWKMFCRQI